MRAPDDEAGPLHALADELRRWLASPGPQAPSGAFYAWIDQESDQPSFEYPEITGYALTHLAGQIHPTPTETRRAAAATRWLTHRFDRGDRSAHHGYDSGAEYNFDLAMIATGLMHAGSALGEKTTSELGLQLAARLQDEIVQSGRLGCLAPGSPASTRSAWSTHGRAHLLKAVQSLLWADSLGRPGALEAARVLMHHCVRAQQADGRFVTHPDDIETMLHPHLYAIEGLWVFATATGDVEARDRAVLGARWALDQQLPSGGLPRYVTTLDGFRGPEQTDATAQALRMGVLLDVSPGRRAALAGRLRDLSRPHLDGLTLAYQPDSAHLNVWASLFAAQALSVSCGNVLDWPSLV